MPEKTPSKILPFEEAGSFIGSLKMKGLRIVQCHGTFDLIHPGHIIHLEEAKSLGDVLVIGDTIIDQYAYLKVQGLTSKNRMISGRFLRQDTHLGGALAVVRHVKQFCDSVRFVSLLGCEPWVDELLGGSLSTAEDATVRDPGFTTVVKKRYVEPLQQGNEISKLFSINYIEENPPGDATRTRLIELVRAELKACDVVLLADFGHGLMQEELRDLVQNEAPLLVLNCQTNSNNHGFNIITRQYRRADAFSLDLQEIMLSCGLRAPDCERELADIAAKFGSKYAWLTRGNVMTIGQAPGFPPVYIPPLVTDITDSVGAGDAFFSLAGLAAARGLPLDVATFLGQLAGAQAVNIIGNERPISKPALLKAALSLLSF